MSGSNKAPKRPIKGNRLLFGIPLTEHLFSHYFRKWLDLRIDPDRVMTMGGIYLPDAHNKMIDFARARRDWDALTWLEHDHEFPAGLVERLESYPDDVDIVGLLYFGRDVIAPWPMAGMWAPKPRHDYVPPARADNPTIADPAGDCEVCGKEASAPRPHAAQPFGMRYLKPSELLPMLETPGLYPVDFVPSGCTFIRRRVFEDWPADELPIYETIADTPERAGAGDDVRFAKLAGKRHTIWLDTALDIKHLATFPIGREYWWERIKLKHYETLHAEQTT